MSILHFKKNVYFKTGNVYSVCLRGARIYQINSGIQFYNATTLREPTLREATVIYSAQFRFADLTYNEYKENYDEEARTHKGLEAAMKEIYNGFNDREIVTILRFKVI